MTALSFMIAFVAMLGVLIFVHELGHFLMAKLFGVRVLKFSLGFGTTVGFGRYKLSWTRGDTEYVVAWFPLGGFVKMLGENPDEQDAPDALAHPSETLNGKPLWQRLLIFSAGPGMNLILPIFIFAGWLMMGMPERAAVIGTVEPGSPAASAGLAPGDRILAVDGEPLRWWNALDEAVRARPEGEIGLRLQRDAREWDVTLPVEARAGLNPLHGVETQGWIGLLHARQQALVGVPDARSPAANAGLHSGDLIVAVAGVEVEDWRGLNAAYAAAQGPVSLSVARGVPPEIDELEISVPKLAGLEALGVLPVGALVKNVTPDYPAAQAGMQAGDLIVAVEGRPLGSFETLIQVVSASEGRPIQVTYARDGENTTVALTPKLTEVELDIGVPDKRYLIGIEAPMALLAGVEELDAEPNPLVALQRGTQMTVTTIGQIITGISMMVTGRVSMDSISGPIGIAVIAHNALQRGIEDYLRILILISVNLGILNLLPIPVLDGGQITLALIEAAKRKPLSLRAKEIYQQVGVAALLFLMGFAFWNDLSRFWGRFVDYLRQSVGL